MRGLQIEHYASAPSTSLLVFVAAVCVRFYLIVTTNSQGTSFCTGLLEVIDAITPWMWHQPASEAAEYPELLASFRHNQSIPSHIPLYPGVYVKNSEMGWLTPASVKDTLHHTIEMYDQGASECHISLYLCVAFFAIDLCTC